MIEKSVFCRQNSSCARVFDPSKDILQNRHAVEPLYITYIKEAITIKSSDSSKSSAVSSQRQFINVATCAIVIVFIEIYDRCEVQDRARPIRIA